MENIYGAILCILSWQIFRNNLKNKKKSMDNQQYLYWRRAVELLEK